jgi:hypothetical protein
VHEVCTEENLGLDDLLDVHWGGYVQRYIFAGAVEQIGFGEVRRRSLFGEVYSPKIRGT